jgi:hypothetical protein
MPNYREKSVTVEAAPYVAGMEHGFRRAGRGPRDDGGARPELVAFILTPAGPRDVRPGDWVVTLADGGTLVYSAAEFAARFEPAP